jgi:hypothetical protein
MDSVLFAIFSGAVYLDPSHGQVLPHSSHHQLASETGNPTSCRTRRRNASIARSVTVSRYDIYKYQNIMSPQDHLRLT